MSNMSDNESNLTGSRSTKELTIGNTPRYVSSGASSFMKKLAEEDIHNRLKRMENDKEDAILDTKKES